MVNYRGGKIPADKDFRCFALQRHIDLRQKRELEKMTGQYSTAVKIFDRDRIALDMVKKGEVIQARRTCTRINSMLFPELVRQLLYPPFTISEGSSSVFAVKNVICPANSSQLALELDDSEGQLLEERFFYTGRLRRLGAEVLWSTFSPTIPFATLLDHRAKHPVIKWTEENAPKSVLLNRATPFPKPPGFQLPINV